ILFGSLLVLALGGTAAIDAKRRRSFGEQWMQFAAVTSNVPFAAIVAGKNRLGPAVVEIGVWRPLVAIVVYAVAFYLHGQLGPPPPYLACDPPLSAAPVLFRLALHRWQKRVVPSWPKKMMQLVRPPMRLIG